MLPCIFLFNYFSAIFFNYSISSRAFVITTENLESNTNHISTSFFLLFFFISASIFIFDISSSNGMSLLFSLISAGVFIFNISFSDNIFLLLLVYLSLLVLLLLILVV
jgi:hypothetical protein